MTRIAGVGAGPAAARRAGRPAGGFAPPAGGAPASPAVATAAPLLLGLLEDAPHRGPARPSARGAARAGLDLLRDLQLDLLRGAEDPARLARLAALAAEAEDAAGADPALRAALAEIGLRLRVELARRRAGRATYG